MFYVTFMGIIHKSELPYFLSFSLSKNHLFTTIVNVIIFPYCNMVCVWGTERILKHFTCCDDECFASISVINRAI